MARRGLPKTYPVLELLCQLSIRVEEPPQFRAWGAILRLDWTHYQDAACPDPAMRLGVPLAALDGAPRQAANRHDVAALFRVVSNLLEYDAWYTGVCSPIDSD